MDTKRTITIELDPGTRTVTITTPGSSIPLLVHPITENTPEIRQHLFLDPFTISLALGVSRLDD